MSSAPQSVLSPFHLAIPVHDIEVARHFYGGVLGLERGRSDVRWTDWNMGGHQVVTHQVDGHGGAAVAGTNPVDGHAVPVPHFGLVLSVPEFKAGRAASGGWHVLRDRAVRAVPRRARRAVDDVLPRPLGERHGVQGLR